MATNYIPQVDYTSRDYTALRADLIDLIPFYAPLWTNRDPADFGITILETFAYMGDILNYYIDKSANEAFISTASQRENILQLAKLLGYKPTEPTAATCTVTFSNASDNTINVPKLTRVATSAVSNASTDQIIFETDAEINVPAGSTTTTVTATQGITVSNELVGESKGTVNQFFELSQSSVISNSISVVVGGTNYTQVPYLIDYSGYDPVFSTYTNGDGATFIIFGDGISGRVPPNTAQIVATYRVGGGASGNVAVNTIKYITNLSTSGLTVLNKYVSAAIPGAASGGADQESTDSIRASAPASIKTLNRAVALSDYASLVVQVSGVAKATAIADVYTSVTVFFAPYGDSGVQVDGVTPSTVFNTLKTKVSSYMTDKVPANTTVTFQPPSYVNVLINASITILPQYKQSLVETAVNSILAELLAFENVAFGDRITLQDVMTTIASVDGVARVSVSKLVRSDEDKTYNITNKVLTSNVATLTTSVTHGLTVGTTVNVTGVDATFNGTYVVTAVTGTTFSYACIATNVTTAAVSITDGVTALIVADVVCDVNEIPKTDYATDISLTLTGGILS
jgi:hypothetical protein